MFYKSLFSAVSVLALTAAATAQSSQQFYSTSTAGSVETIVVTATPLSTDADATATIAGKIDRDQILQNGGNLADALSDIPGVSGSGFAAGASRPIIRGMDATRVRVMEDGVGSFDVSDIGPDHGVPIDPLAADSIEVVRGAATLRYGSGAIGGVVNAVNNRVPLSLPETARGEVTGAYASSANLGETSASNDFAAGDFAIHADGFYRTAGDYDTPDGRQNNSFSVGSGLSLGTSYFFGSDDHVGVAWVQNDAKYGIPSDTTYILMRQTKVLADAAIDMGTDTFGALSVNTGYANYSHEEKNPDGSVNTTFENREFEGRAEQMIGALGPFSASAVGVQVQSRSYQALGEDSSYLYPTYTGSFAGFFFTEAPLSDALKLQLGGRFERVHISGTPASDAYTVRNFTPVSGAASLVFDAATWLKLGLTASSSARAPAQTELFARGPHDGPGTYETGNPGLKIERANALEATARIRTGKLSLDGSLWASQFDNYIYGALTGRRCDEDQGCGIADGDLKELNYDQSGAHFWGMEAKATYDLATFAAGKLAADVQYDYVRARLSGGANVPGGADVPRIPPYHVGGGVSFTAMSFDLGLTALYAGRQTNFGAYDTPTPAYVELSAHAGWRPFKSNPGFALVLAAHNLTDDTQRNAAALNKDAVEMPGRDIRLVLRQSL
jgi:iron complex outermembrane recepter protein